MSLSKKKNLSLSEKVTEILNQDNESEYELETVTQPQVEYFDDEDYNLEKSEQNKSLSQFRKQNVQLLSQQSSKYSGEVVPRKNIENSTSSDESDPGGSGNDEAHQWNSSDYIEWKDEGNYSCSDDATSNESSIKNLETVKTTVHEREKGVCVQNQLSIWEQLLEIRIHSQKLLSKANSLPNPDHFSKLSSMEDFRKSSQDVQKNTAALLEKLLEAQSCLANQFSEIKQLRMTTKPKHTDDAPNKRFESAIKSNFERFRPYRNSVLLKWDDRTKLLSSSFVKKKKEQPEFDIIMKIENSLTKKNDLIAKSQVLKAGYAIDGEKKSVTTEDPQHKDNLPNPHIYDDTDFYHSQLRELIEVKTNASSNAFDVSKQFAELQKIRQKMKKKVDTRASKGRKLRYVVHPKLMNFMGPVNSSEWTEESKDELYRSLFIT